MRFSLDKSKCKLFNQQYKYVLSKYLGIGQKDIDWSELLHSYLLLNNSFFPQSITGSPSVTTQYIGIVTSDGTLLPGETTVAKFFINDQEAFDNGVEKGQIYYLSLDNTYGSPYGTPKLLVEDVE